MTGVDFYFGHIEHWSRNGKPPPPGAVLSVQFDDDWTVHIVPRGDMLARAKAHHDRMQSIWRDAYERVQKSGAQA